MKGWYTINSPPYFGGTSIGSAPSAEPDRMIGRVVEVTLYDLTNDPSQQHLKLYFQIINVKGEQRK